MTSRKRAIFAGAMVSMLAAAPACHPSEDIKADKQGTPVQQVNPDAASKDVVVADGPLPHSGCPKDLPGAPMVEVPAPDGSLYCIDSREVKQGEYFEFMSVFLVDPLQNAVKKPDANWPSGPACENNVSLMPFQPDDSPCSTTPQAFSAKNQYPSYPIACVDWCDAYAYCAWAGKRLCGRIGGGSLAPTEVTDATKAQWYNVCSQGGKTAYAYGDAYRGDLSNAATMSTDAATQCRGTSQPFDQVVQIGCNVLEWQDACEKHPAWTGCGMQFASAGNSSPEVGWRCDRYDEVDIREKDPSVGFRCCRD
jgi:formylglycine-generating enzyme